MVSQIKAATGFSGLGCHFDPDWVDIYPQCLCTSGFIRDRYGTHFRGYSEFLYNH